MDNVRLMNLSGTTKTTVRYLVKNKDRVLASFNWDGEEDVELLEDLGLPRFVLSEFREWLSSRTPPKYREHMKELLTALGLDSLKSILDFSKGLSLTDTMWVCPEDSDLCWRDVSLFQNPFDEVIAHIAFEGGLHGIPLSTTTPELGTNGMLAKCWVKDPETGSIVLVKTGTTGASNAGNEPFSENLAHQVLTKLDYKHVTYTVARYHGKLVSVCPLFTSEQEMLLPIYRYYDFRSIDRLLELTVKDGIAVGLAQHLIFDYLSWNTDRHAGNLGVILDADSFKLKQFSSIFDNGASMLNYWNGEDDLEGYVQCSTPALYDSFERGAKLGRKILDNGHNVQRLIGFKFDRSQVPGYPDSRIDAIENWLQGRAQKFLSMP